MSEIKIEVKA